MYKFIIISTTTVISWIAHIMGWVVGRVGVGGQPEVGYTFQQDYLKDLRVQEAYLVITVSHWPFSNQFRGFS